MKWFGLNAFVALFVFIGILREKKRSAVHWVVLFIVAAVTLVTVRTALNHYREVRNLQTLDETDLIYVSIGQHPRIVDTERIEMIVQALRTPVDFLASRDNHGEAVSCTLGIKGGIQKHFELSRATKTRGAVLRIPGGGTVLYRELEWLIPDKPN